MATIAVGSKVRFTQAFVNGNLFNEVFDRRYVGLTGKVTTKYSSMGINPPTQCEVVWDGIRGRKATQHYCESLLEVV